MRTDFGVTSAGSSSPASARGHHEGLPHFLEVKFMILEGHPDGYAESAT